MPRVLTTQRLEMSVTGFFPSVYQHAVHVAVLILIKVTCDVCSGPPEAGMLFFYMIVCMLSYVCSVSLLSCVLRGSTERL